MDHTVLFVASNDEGKVEYFARQVFALVKVQFSLIHCLKNWDWWRFVLKYILKTGDICEDCGEYLKIVGNICEEWWISENCGEYLWRLWISVKIVVNICEDCGEYLWRVFVVNIYGDWSSLSMLWCPVLPQLRVLPIPCSLTLCTIATLIKAGK